MIEGASIGQYRVIAKLGEGGMGIVFEAVHEAIERHVAIKVLHPEYAKNAEFAKRFVNEARAVNRVDHPGLVQISDYGQLPDGSAYIVMEYIKGETLRSRLERAGGSLPVADAVRISLQLADCLAAAHAEGIVHRDLKPDNVMIVRSPRRGDGERTKLLDFGIAKLFEDTPEHVKTRTNAVMGTPVYMSPEQCRGAGGVDHKSDVYSLGIMMYLMLAGCPPFRGDGLGEILGKHMYEEPPALAGLARNAPVVLVELIHRMLRKSKDQRPSMGEVATSLDAMGNGLGTQDIRRAPTAADSPTIHASLLGTSPDRAQLERISTLGLSVGQTPAALRRRKGAVVGSAIGLLAVVSLGGSALQTARWKRAQSHAAASSTLAMRDVSSGNNLLDEQMQKGAGDVTSAPGLSETDHLAPLHEDAKVVQEATTPDPMATHADPEPGASKAAKAEKAERKAPSTAVLVQQGRAKLRAGEPAAAAALFTIAVGLDGRSAEALGGLGRASFEQGSFAAAVRYLTLAVELAPRRAVGYQELLAQALYETGRFQEAADNCRVLLKQVPGSTAARHTLLLAERMLQARAKTNTSQAALPASEKASGQVDNSISRVSPIQQPIQKALGAQQLYDQGQYAAAVEAGQRDARSGVRSAWRIVGLAACRARNSSAASEAYLAAQPEVRQHIVAMCSENGYRWINNAFRGLD